MYCCFHEERENHIEWNRYDLNIPHGWFHSAIAIDSFWMSRKLLPIPNDIYFFLFSPIFFMKNHPLQISDKDLWPINPPTTTRHQPPHSQHSSYPQPIPFDIHYFPISHAIPTQRMNRKRSHENENEIKNRIFPLCVWPHPLTAINLSYVNENGGTRKKNVI